MGANENMDDSGFDCPFILSACPSQVPVFVCWLGWVGGGVRWVRACLRVCV